MEKEKNGKEFVLKTEELEEILKIEQIRTNLLFLAQQSASALSLRIYFRISGQHCTGQPTLPSLPISK